MGETERPLSAYENALESISELETERDKLIELLRECEKEFEVLVVDTAGTTVAEYYKAKLKRIKAVLDGK